MAEGLIELRLSRVQQVFNSLDPTPFPERDLDDAAVEFIVEWAKEFAPEVPLRLVVHLPESEREGAAAARIPEAVASYFEYRRQTEARRLRSLLSLGRRSAAIGLLFLGACNLASEGLAALSDDPLTKLVRQGLIIFGWVANWRPAEIFLYEWWPIRRMVRLYGRLSHMPVELRFATVL